MKLKHILWPWGEIRRLENRIKAIYKDVTSGFNEFGKEIWRLQKQLSTGDVKKDMAIHVDKLFQRKAEKLQEENSRLREENEKLRAELQTLREEEEE